MRYPIPVLTFAMALSLGVATPTWGQVINEDFKLLANDGAETDRLGYSIAIDQGVIAVGATQDGRGNPGKAYLFSAFTGAQIGKFVPTDGVANELFGSSIAIDNGIVAVGALGSPYRDPGSVYVFDASTGLQTVKLYAIDAAVGDRFGYSIAVEDGVIAVGAPKWSADNLGAAYLFDAATGAQIAKLTASDGIAHNRFGYSIAIDNGIVAIGAPLDDAQGYRSGSAYLFDATTGLEIAKLIPSDGAEDDEFGNSIAIDNGIVAVGARNDGDYGIDYGSAYLFDATTGVQLAKLLPSDGEWGDRFGTSIAIANGVVAVGAKEGDYHGSAYLFDAATGAQFAKLLPSDDWSTHEFGGSIAMANGVVAVGAPRGKHNGLETGSAYVFGVGPYEDCIDFIVENLVAGEQATFTITNGRVGAKAIVVFGTEPGYVSVRNYAGYCATFGIAGVTPNKVIGGYRRVFDANGEIAFGLNVPDKLAGQRVFFQSAEQGTCPYECVSNLVEMVVQ